MTEPERWKPCAQPVAKTLSTELKGCVGSTPGSVIITLHVSLSLSARPFLLPNPFPISQSDVKMVAGFMSVQTFWG